MKNILLITIVVLVSATNASFADDFVCPRHADTIEAEKTTLDHIAFEFEVREVYESVQQTAPFQECYRVHLQILKNMAKTIHDPLTRAKEMRQHDDIALRAHLMLMPLGQYYTSAQGQTHLERIIRKVPLLDRPSLLRALGRSDHDVEVAGAIELSKFLGMILPKYFDSKMQSDHIGHFADRNEMHGFVDSVYDQQISSMFHLDDMRSSPLYEEFKTAHNAHSLELNGGKLVYDGLWSDDLVLNTKAGIIEH